MKSNMIPNVPKAKSMVLTPQEKDAFQLWVNKFPRKKDAADELDFSMPLLSRLYYTGRGSEDTITKVRSVISVPA